MTTLHKTSIVSGLHFIRLRQEPVLAIDPARTHFIEMNPRLADEAAKQFDELGEKSILKRGSLFNKPVTKKPP